MGLIVYSKINQSLSIDSNKEKFHAWMSRGIFTRLNSGLCLRLHILIVYILGPIANGVKEIELLILYSIVDDIFFFIQL